MGILHLNSCDTSLDRGLLSEFTEAEVLPRATMTWMIRQVLHVPFSFSGLGLHY